MNYLCTHWFAMSNGIRVNVRITYSGTKLQDWRATEEFVKNLITGFIVAGEYPANAAH